MARPSIIGTNDVITTITLTGPATTTKTVSLSVLHPSGNYIAAIDVTPAFITGGTSASGTVTLALPSSDHGGSEIALASSNAALSVPANLKVNPNSSMSAFTIATSAVTAPVPVVVTASYGGVTQRMNVIVAPENAVTLSSFTIVPNRVTGGAPAMATVTLNRAAPFGGARVTVEARRRNIVTVPDAVVVPEGASLITFSIATDPLHAAREKSLEIVATYNNVSASATLTVLPTAQATSSRKPEALCASLVLVPCVTQSAARAIKPLGGGDDGPPPSTTPTLFEQQYTFYTPELNLMSETNSTSTVATPVIAYDYVWFGGQPLAQIENATGNVAWYFNDHLGTPIRQTDNSGRVLWHAEYEPYGTIYAIRRGESRHQPLRLPGQTAEEGSDLYQNVFRFYRAGWGRYTQPDPIKLKGGLNLFAYGSENPISHIDLKGLKCSSSCPDCPGKKWLTYGADLGFTAQLGSLGYGASVGFFNARCLSSSKHCTFFSICSRGFGLGLSAALSGGGGLTINAPCASDFEGLSWGIDAEVLDEGGGTGGFEVSDSGAISMKGAAGVGGGASGTFNLCRVVSVSCN